MPQILAERSTERTFNVTNQDFIDAVAGTSGINTWVCGFTASPASHDAPWGGHPHTTGKALVLDESGNTYFGTAELRPGGKRRKADFVRMLVLVADDGDPTNLTAPPSYIIRTSPGKRQIGYILRDTLQSRDPVACDQALKGMVAKGLAAADKSGNNIVRYVRLPAGRNTKYPDHPAHVLELWNPDLTYTLSEALAAFGVDPAGLASTEAAQRVVGAVAGPDGGAGGDDDDPFAGVLMPERLDVDLARRQILSGEALHDPLLRLSAHHARHGMPEPEILRVMRELMNVSAAKDAPDAPVRWQDRMDKLPAMVRTAVAKFAPQYALKEDFTDTGNVNVLARLSAGDLRYVPELKTWLVWTRGRWETDSAMVEAGKAAKAVAKHWHEKAALSRADEAGLEGAELKARKKITDGFKHWEGASRSRRGVENMLALAMKDARFVVGQSQLDTHPDLLGVQNGVVDLRTGQLRADAREEFVTQRCAVAFDPEAEAPCWDRFITEVCGDPLPALRDHTGAVVAETVGRFTRRPQYEAALQVVLGYSCTGNTSAQKIIIAYGEHGANGKSLLAETVGFVLGTYAGTAKPELLMVNRRGESDANKATPALVVLRGKRFVTMSEPKAGVVLENAVVKSLTGDAVLSVRANYGNEIQMRVGFHLMMLCNHLPVFEHMEQAVTGRVWVLPFDRQWNRPGVPGRNAELPDADPGLAAALQKEATGILAWLVRGAVKFHREGVAPCETVADATRDYIHAQDPVAKWLSQQERCDARVGVGAERAFQAFSAWRTAQEAAETMPPGVSPATQHGFSAKLQALGVFRVEVKAGRRYSFRLSEPVDPRALELDDWLATVV